MALAVCALLAARPPPPPKPSPPPPKGHPLTDQLHDLLDSHQDRASSLVAPLACVRAEQRTLACMLKIQRTRPHACRPAYDASVWECDQRDYVCGALVCTGRIYCSESSEQEVQCHAAPARAAPPPPGAHAPPRRRWVNPYTTPVRWTSSDPVLISGLSTGSERSECTFTARAPTGACTWRRPCLPTCHVDALSLATWTPFLLPRGRPFSCHVAGAYTWHVPTIDVGVTSAAEPFAGASHPLLLLCRPPSSHFATWPFAGASYSLLLLCQPPSSHIVTWPSRCFPPFAAMCVVERASGGASWWGRANGKSVVLGPGAPTSSQ